jgi:hypothetical protein
MRIVTSMIARRSEPDRARPRQASIWSDDVIRGPHQIDADYA